MWRAAWSLKGSKADREQVESLYQMKIELEKNSGGKASKGEREALPYSAQRGLCAEIKVVLKEWKWNGDGRVEFDQKEFDIVVDGQSRQSHGKGVRAVLHTAFTKGEPGSAKNGPVDVGIEAAFWQSLTSIDSSVQVLIVENKEPPASVAAALTYHWFAGDTGQPSDRIGFIPHA